MQRGLGLGELRLVPGELLAHVFDYLGRLLAGGGLIRKLPAVVGDILFKLLFLFLQTLKSNVLVDKTTLPCSGGVSSSWNSISIFASLSIMCAVPIRY